MTALPVFPSSLYKRLLRATKCIDKANSQCAFQSLLCGKPSMLYSYELGQNIEIGTSSYSLYDKLVSIMNDGEYSTPVYVYPISFFSIARNTARLCTNRNKKNEEQKTKYSIFNNYCQDIALTKAELIEIVNNFEYLAIIAQKQNNMREKQKGTIDPLGGVAPKNTFACDVIDWAEQSTDNDLETELRNVLSNEPSISKMSKIPKKLNSLLTNDKDVENDGMSLMIQQKTKPTIQSKTQPTKRKVEPILEYIPKTVYDDATTMWKNCILFQHPLATMSEYNGSKDNDIYQLFEIDSKIEPHILLGLFAQSTHPKLKLTGS